MGAEAPVGGRAEVEAALRRLAGAATELRARPVGEVITALGRAGARFLSEDDPYRLRALEGLPDAARISAEMARVVLDGMASDWTEERLLALVKAEFDHPAVLDGFVERPAAGSAGARRVRAVESAPPRRIRAVGPRLCVQIVSGSVPGVSVHALIRSLLVKAPTLLKPGRGDALLPGLFREALAEEDPDLAAVLEVAYWPGGSDDIERVALSAADVAVIYGSDETVESLRAMAPATTRVVAYQHRVGVGVVGREALGSEFGSADRTAATAADVARAVALFEQRGCVCPQMVFVEEGGSSAPADFARALAAAFADIEGELPSPPLTTDQASALVQLRGTMEMHEAAGSVELHHGGSEAPWTVIFEGAPVPVPGDAPRTVRIRPVADIVEVGEAVEPLGPHLQSVGYVGTGSRAAALAEVLGQAGASRVVSFPALSFPPPWWLHDGRGPLRELVRWVEWE